MTIVKPTSPLTSQVSSATQALANRFLSNSPSFPEPRRTSQVDTLTPSKPVAIVAPQPTAQPMPRRPSATSLLQLNSAPQSSSSTSNGNLLCNGLKSRIINVPLSPRLLLTAAVNSSQPSSSVALVKISPNSLTLPDSSARATSQRPVLKCRTVRPVVSLLETQVLAAPVVQVEQARPTPPPLNDDVIVIDDNDGNEAAASNKRKATSGGSLQSSKNVRTDEAMTIADNDDEDDIVFLNEQPAPRKLLSLDCKRIDWPPMSIIVFSFSIPVIFGM